MVFERKLKGGLHGNANYEKSYLSWIHLIEQTCPSKEKQLTDGVGGFAPQMSVWPNISFK